MPSYQWPAGRGVDPGWTGASVARRKLPKGAEKTAATSLASRRGIMESGGEWGWEEEELVEFELDDELVVAGVSGLWRRATQGRTARPLRARL